MNNQTRITHVTTITHNGWIELYSYKEIPLHKLTTIRASAYGEQ